MVEALTNFCRSVDLLRECGVYTQQLHSRSVALHV